MDVYATYKSLRTSKGIKTFRYNTQFQSVHGPGQPIGLIVMMNPGDARPVSDDIFYKLETEEHDTTIPVLTKSDKTMDRTKNLIANLYRTNNKELPVKFTIHVENLFNIREKKSEKAKNLAQILTEAKDLMYKTREFCNTYHFVFFAWGNTNINPEKQKLLWRMFPEAISVHKLNIKGTITDVKYPVHPLYMKTDYFINSSKGKLIIKQLEDD